MSIGKNTVQAQTTQSMSNSAHTQKHTYTHTHTHTKRRICLWGAGTCTTLNGGACCINVQGADPVVSIRRPPTCTETKPKLEPRTRSVWGGGLTRAREVPFLKPEIDDGLGSPCTRARVQIVPVFTSVCSRCVSLCVPYMWWIRARASPKRAPAPAF